MVDFRWKTTGGNGNEWITKPAEMPTHVGLLPMQISSQKVALRIAGHRVCRNFRKAINTSGRCKSPTNLGPFKVKLKA